MVKNPGVSLGATRSRSLWLYSCLRSFPVTMKQPHEFVIQPLSFFLFSRCSISLLCSNHFCSFAVSMAFQSTPLQLSMYLSRSPYISQYLCASIRLSISSGLSTSRFTVEPHNFQLCSFLQISYTEKIDINTTSNTWSDTTERNDGHS